MNHFTNKWQLSVEDLVAVATLNFLEFMLDWKTIRYLVGSTEWPLAGDWLNLLQRAAILKYTFQQLQQHQDLNQKLIIIQHLNFHGLSQLEED